MRIEPALPRAAAGFFTPLGLDLCGSKNAPEFGAPNWIRTSGPQIRNLMLYPAELWVHQQMP